MRNQTNPQTEKLYERQIHRQNNPNTDKYTDRKALRQSYTQTENIQKKEANTGDQLTLQYFF